jgi:hypothetical protein
MSTSAINVDSQTTHPSVQTDGAQSTTAPDHCAEKSRRERALHLLQIDFDKRKLPRTLREEFKDCYQSDVQVQEDIFAAKAMKNESSSTISSPERTLSQEEKQALKDAVREWAHSGSSLEAFPADQYGSKNVATAIEAFWMSGVPGADGDRYFVFQDGLFIGSWKTRGNSTYRELSRLTNFVVTTIRRVVYDDGASQEVTFEIDATFKGAEYRQKSLENADFHKMEWPMYLIDPAAVRFTDRAHTAQVAIQLTARHLPERRIHTHTGWIGVQKNEDDTEWFYLHANGAIGAKGMRFDLKAEPRSQKVRQIALPEPPTGEAAKEAFRASLKFLELGPYKITMPLYAAIWRPPLPDPNLTVWALGLTGSFKTSVLLLVQQHYGAGFTDENVSHWNDTDNSVLRVLHEAKDAPWLVDDYVPEGSNRDRQDKQVDNVVRGVANQTGRGRANRNGTPQPDRPPRALLLVSGEDRSAGHSKASRTIFDRFTPGAINKMKLTAAQKDAAAGFFAQANAAYLKWLAPQYPELKSRTEKRVAELRSEFEAKGRHQRTAENLASLAVGFEMFLECAVSHKAITPSESAELWRRFMEAMKHVADEQDSLQKTEDPIVEALRMLKAAKHSGRIYLVGETDDAGTKVAPDPHAIKIGQLDENGSWMCLPDTLYSTMLQLYREQGRTFPKTKDEFLQELKERGKTETDQGRTLKKAPRSWTSPDESRPRIVYFPAQTFAEEEDQ